MRTALPYALASSSSRAPTPTHLRPSGCAHRSIRNRPRMAAKKSVDEIWRELNAKTAPSRAKSGAKPAAPYAVQLPKPLKPKPAPVEQLSAGANDDVVDFRKPTAQYSPELAGVAADDFHSYVAGMQRSINCLSDPDRPVRLQALQAISVKLLQGGASSPKPSPQLLQAVVCGPLLYPSAQLLSDSAEKIRTTAIQLWTAALQQVPSFDAALPVLMPEIVKRIGTAPVQEPSEEVRLQLVQLVKLLLVRGGPASASYAPEFCSILQQAQADSFPQIKKDASSALGHCCRVLPRAALESRLEKLAQVVVPNLQHSHWRVRCAALEALDALMLLSLPVPCVQSLVLPVLKTLATDHSLNVRQLLFTLLAGWLGYQLQSDAQQPNGSRNGSHAGAPAGVGEAAAGRVATPGIAGARKAEGEGQQTGEQQAAAVRKVQRLTSYAPVLLPVLLLGLTDPQEDLAASVLQLVEHVGEAYVAAKHAAGGSSHPSSQAGSTDMEHDSVHPAGLRSAANGSAGGVDAPSSAAEHAEPGPGSATAAAAVAATDPSWLGAPYQGPPGALCRQMAGELLPGVLQLIYTELAEWTAAARSCAARCLHSVLVLAGPAVHPHLPRLLPLLVFAVADTDPQVAQQVVKCVHALGTYTAPQAWVPLLLDLGPSERGATVTDAPVLAPSSDSQRASALVVLSGLLHAASKCGHSLDDTMVRWLGEWLSQQAVSCSEGGAAPAVWRQLLAVVMNTLSWLGPRSQLCSAALFAVLLHLSGSLDALESAAGSDGGASITLGLDKLAGYCQLAGPEQLAELHAQALLTSICRDHATWTAQSPNYLTLKALLKACGAATLVRLLPRVGELLRSCLVDEERDANLRISMLQLLDELAEQPHLAPCFAGDASEAWLSQLLLPCLVWRAGKVAAAIRFAAITALATLLSRRLPSQAVLLRLVEGGMLPLLFQCLDEDWYSDVRRSSCFVVEQLLAACGPSLTPEVIRTIYPELLKRLDDSSTSVRVAACAALVALAKGLAPGYCSTNAGYLAAGVVVHMDDSNPEVQEAACGVLLALAAVKPAEVAREVAKVQGQFRAAHYCRRVLDACDASAGLQQPGSMEA